jgi:hypothetical protein
MKSFVNSLDKNMSEANYIKSLEHLKKHGWATDWFLG